jgi:hypothetical protein
MRSLSSAVGATFARIDCRTTRRVTIVSMACDRTIRGVLTALLIFPSCGTNDPPALAPIPDTVPTLTVDVGTGAVEYEPLADGDPVDLIFGPQGGWHIWTGVNVHDATVESVRMNLYSRFEDGALAGDPSSVAAALEPVKDGGRSHASMRNFIRDGALTRGKRLLLRVEVIAGDGRHGAGERRVVVR